MQANKVAEVTRISLGEIKEMGAASGPCISILLPLEGAAQDPLRIRQAINTAEKLLQERVGAPKAHEILAKARELVEGTAYTGKGLAIYCSSEFCRAFDIPTPLSETVSVADHFNVKPLIPLLNADQPFYILALSQKHIRLLRCTEHTSEEVPLAGEVPKALWDDMYSDKPDHNQDNRATGGHDTGSMKGVAFTTSTDVEDRPEYLAHFYKHVSEGVAAQLKDEGAPLVIAGVDYETALYRKMNTYPHLVEEVVHGAADGLKGGELHKRALEAVRGFFNAPLKAAQARFEEIGGSARGSSTVKEIVKASIEGRVMELILAEGATYMGNFNESTHDVKGHKQPEAGDEDLLNVAALQTLLHAGQVFVVPAKEVPHGAPAVAVFRY